MLSVVVKSQKGRCVLAQEISDDIRQIDKEKLDKKRRKALEELEKSLNTYIEQRFFN